MIIKRVELKNGGKSILIRLEEELTLVGQLNIKFKIASANGLKIEDNLYLTVHKISSGRRLNYGMIFLILLILTVAGYYFINKYNSVTTRTDL